MIDKAKILAFALKYWKEILVVLSLSLVTLKTRMDYNALNKAYEISQNEMELQINTLRDIHEEELDRRDEALQTYRDAIEDLHRRYLDSQTEIEEDREERAEEYERQFSQDKEGLEYVE